MANDNFDLPRPTDPVPSATAPVINDNAKVLDYIINSTGTVFNRTGGELLTIREALNKFGFGVADFTFTTGGTLDSLNLLVPNSPVDGFLYKYVGSGSAPVAITPGTDPTSGTEWQAFSSTNLQTIGGLTDRSDLSQRYRFNTTATEIASGVFEIGDLLTLKDRDDAPFEVVDSTGYVANGKDIIDAGSEKVAIIPASVDAIYLEWLGDVSGDCYALLDHAYNMIRCTVSGTSDPGRLAGKELRLKCRIYQISQTLTVGAPITIVGEGNGIATDSSERPILSFTGSGAGIFFGVNSGYCSFDNFTMKGVKSGTVNPEGGIYGNRALDISQGYGGVMSRMSFEGWDVGVLQHQRPGTTWSGAYRLFSFCRFRNNTYHLAHLNVTTDGVYSGCDFRTNDSSGYILISASELAGGFGAYQNVFMDNCMFEILGGNNFDNRGIQIKGKSTLYLKGRYLEKVAVFVDKEASLVSSAYHRTESGTSSRIGGGGFVDLTGAFAHQEQFDFPLLDDALWAKNNVSGGTVDYVDGKLCNKITVTGLSFPQLGLDFSECFRSSIKALPRDWRTMIALISFDYNSKAGTTASVKLEAQDQSVANKYSPAVSTWTDEEYYDNDSGWKRKVYTLPFNPDAMGTLAHNTAAIRAYIDFKGSSLAVNDVFGIRNLKIEFLAM